MHLSHTPTTLVLSVEEQRSLISTAQDVTVEVLDEGTEQERAVYAWTPEADAALERLTTAFLPALRRAASRAKVIDSDDAFSVSLEAFVCAVRDYDTSSDLPFSATIPTFLSYAVALADRTSDLIRVPDAPAARYWRLLHKHGHDVEAAFVACHEGGTGLDPVTFLAIHRVMTSLTSLDVALEANHDLAPSTAGPEERVVQSHLVSWLFELVTTRQEAILRLRLGFRDATTLGQRMEKGYRETGLLDDAQVAHVLDLTRPTVQRDRAKALGVMREAMAGLLAETE